MQIGRCTYTPNDLFNHFRQLSIDNQTVEGEFPLIMGPSLDNSDLNKEFDEKEISDCINNLKNGKAAGIDLILNEYISALKTL